MMVALSCLLVRPLKDTDLMHPTLTNLIVALLLSLSAASAALRLYSMSATVRDHMTRHQRLVMSTHVITALDSEAEISDVAVRTVPGTSGWSPDKVPRRVAEARQSTDAAWALAESAYQAENSLDLAGRGVAPGRLLLPFLDSVASWRNDMDTNRLSSAQIWLRFAPIRRRVASRLTSRLPRADVTRVWAAQKLIQQSVALLGTLHIPVELHPSLGFSETEAAQRVARADMLVARDRLLSTANLAADGAGSLWSAANSIESRRDDEPLPWPNVPGDLLATVFMQVSGANVTDPSDPNAARPGPVMVSTPEMRTVARDFIGAMNDWDAALRALQSRVLPGSTTAAGGDAFWAAEGFHPWTIVLHLAIVACCSLLALLRFGRTGATLTDLQESGAGRFPQQKALLGAMSAVADSLADRNIVEAEDRLREALHAMDALPPAGGGAGHAEGGSASLRIIGAALRPVRSFLSYLDAPNRKRLLKKEEFVLRAAPRALTLCVLDYTGLSADDAVLGLVDASVVGEGKDRQGPRESTTRHTVASSVVGAAASPVQSLATLRSAFDREMAGRGALVLPPTGSQRLVALWGCDGTADVGGLLPEEAALQAAAALFAGGGVPKSIMTQTRAAIVTTDLALTGCIGGADLCSSQFIVAGPVFSMVDACLAVAAHHDACLVMDKATLLSLEGVPINVRPLELLQFGRARVSSSPGPTPPVTVVHEVFLTDKLEDSVAALQWAPIFSDYLQRDSASLRQRLKELTTRRDITSTRLRKSVARMQLLARAGAFVTVVDHPGDGQSDETVTNHLLLHA